MHRAAARHSGVGLKPTEATAFVEKLRLTATPEWFSRLRRGYPE
jgi:hypothetical protein